MAVKREKVHFETVEELLGAPIEKDATTEVRIDQIFPFENHPFKVLDDDKMEDLVQSIKDNGVLTPVLLRPDDEGTYEMISGHRRMHAAKLAGLVTIPAIIKPMCIVSRLYPKKCNENSLFISCGIPCYWKDADCSCYYYC